MIDQSGRTDCAPLLAPEEQQQFLVDYVADFLTTLFTPDPNEALAARTRLGVDLRQPAPAKLYGRPARVTHLSAADDRLTVFVPQYENALTINALGGGVTAEGVTLFYCPPGYYTPTSAPGTEPCRRVNFTLPANPGQAVVSWTGPAA